MSQSTLLPLSKFAHNSQALVNHAWISQKQ